MLDEHHNQLLKDWRAQLHPRKKVLALISNIEHKQILSGGPLGGHCLGLNNFFCVPSVHVYSLLSVHQSLINLILFPFTYSTFFPQDNVFSLLFLLTKPLTLLCSGSGGRAEPEEIRAGDFLPDERGL